MFLSVAWGGFELLFVALGALIRHLMSAAEESSRLVGVFGHVFRVLGLIPAEERNERMIGGMTG